MCAVPEVGMQDERHSTAKDPGAQSFTRQWETASKQEMLLLSCKEGRLHVAQEMHKLAQKTSQRNELRLRQTSRILILWFTGNPFNPLKWV